MAIEEKSKKCNPLVAVLVVVVIALITAITVLLILRSLGGETKKKRNVCESPECINLAHRLHNFADTSVDPCVDFFKFSCGNYHLHFNGEKSEKSLLILKVLEEFLRKNTTSETRSEKMLKMAYRECKSGKPSAEDALANIAKIGKWPLLDSNWTDGSFDLNDWLVNMAKLPTHQFGLFQINVFYAFNVATVTKEEEFLPKGHLIRLITSLLTFGNIRITDAVEAQIATDMKDVFDVLDKMNSLEADGTIPYQQLKENLPSIPFDDIFQTLTPGRQLDFIKVAKKLKITNYFLFQKTDNNLEKIIADTPKRVLANLLIAQYISTNVKQLMPTTNCVGWTMDQMPQAGLKVFASNYFDHENIQLVSEMVDELKISYTQMFKESEWLSEPTRKSALKKLDKMTKSVGYPDGWKEGVEKTYEKLDIQPTDTVMKIISKTLKFRAENELINTLDDGSLFSPSHNHLSVNAYYVPKRNHLSMNTGAMDDPMFDATFPMFAKLAGNGQILGHEIGHAFDSGRVFYDENGVRRKWWTLEDEKMFQEKGQCFVKQYENYDDPEFGKTLNGTLTLGEMMADQLGTEAIWKTYKRLHTSDEPDLAGFEGYSIDKLFFRVRAMNWCSNPTTKTQDEQLEDEHPTNSFRVNGVVSNMKQFAEAYNCPAGSPMNPEKKCTVF